jgi:hypothetical protein
MTARSQEDIRFGGEPFQGSNGERLVAVNRTNSKTSNDKTLVECCIGRISASKFVTKRPNRVGGARYAAFY